MRPTRIAGFSAARRWALPACAALLLIAIGCQTSERELGPGSDMQSVETVETNVVFDCIGAPGSDPNAYTERRVFLESQGWWGEERADGTVPKRGNAEHIHVGMCFPLQQQVSGSRPFHVRVMAHNLPANSTVLTTNLHDPESGTFVKITWNHNVTSQTVTLTRNVTINTADVPSGNREFRVLTSVRRPDGAEIHASSGWCWRIGAGTNDSGNCDTAPLNTTGRGWYDCFEYKIAEIRDFTYPYGGIPRNTNRQIEVGLRDGAGDHTLVTSWEVRLNPDFHAGDNGTVVAQGSGWVNNHPLTLNLPAGLHRLVLIASSRDRCTVGAGITPQDGEVSAVEVIPIMVN